MGFPSRSPHIGIALTRFTVGAAPCSSDWEQASDYLDFDNRCEPWHGADSDMNEQNDTPHQQSNAWDEWAQALDEYKKAQIEQTKTLEKLFSLVQLVGQRPINTPLPADWSADATKEELKTESESSGKVNDERETSDEDGSQGEHAVASRSSSFTSMNRARCNRKTISLRRRSSDGNPFQIARNLISEGIDEEEAWDAACQAWKLLPLRADDGWTNRK